MRVIIAAHYLLRHSCRHRQLENPGKRFPLTLQVLIRSQQSKISIFSQSLTISVSGRMESIPSLSLHEHFLKSSAASADQESVYGPVVEPYVPPLSYTASVASIEYHPTPVTQSSGTELAPLSVETYVRQSWAELPDPFARVLRSRFQGQSQS